MIIPGVVVIQVGPTYLCRQLTRLRQNVLSAVITSPHFIFLNEHYFLIDWTSIPQRFYLVYFILEKAASGFPAVLCPSPPPECTLDTDGQDLFLKALCSIKKMLFTLPILVVHKYKDNDKNTVKLNERLYMCNIFEIPNTQAFHV